MQNKKLFMSASAASIAVVMALLVATSTWSSAEQVEAQEEPTTGPLVSFDTPEAFMEAGGGRAAVVMERPTQEYQVSRDHSVRVPIVLKTSAAGDNPSQFVNLEISGPKGTYLYPADLAAATTEEERIQAAMTGKQIPGSIDLNAFITVDQENANVKATTNRNTILHVNLSVPQDLPDSMIGKTFEIPIFITATDDEGNAETVYVDGSYVIVEVTK